MPSGPWRGPSRAWPPCSGPAETGADLDGLRLAVSQALGTGVGLRLYAEGEAHRAGAAAGNGEAGAVSVPIIVGDTVTGELTAHGAHGDLAVAASLVLRAAASSAGRLLDLARHARELPIRSRSELIAELLMSDAPLSEDLRDRAMHLAVPIGGWHVAVRIEAENLDEAGRDEVHRFELLETAGQAALQATARTGGSWYLSRIARAIVLVRMTSSHPGAQAGLRAARSAEAALAAISGRLPGLRLRGGVGTPHEGPMGLRASAAEARIALVAARSAGRPEGVATHDATGVQRMLMEWYASDTAQASVRAQLAPLERLGRPGRDRDPDPGRLPRPAGLDRAHGQRAAPAPQRGDLPAAPHHRPARRRSRRPRPAPRPAARLPRPSPGVMPPGRRARCRPRRGLECQRKAS